MLAEAEAMVSVALAPSMLATTAVYLAAAHWQLAVLLRLCGD